LRYLIAADLRTTGKDYAGFHEEIKSIGYGRWWHYLTSVWLVDTILPIQDVDIRLRAHLSQNDSLLVVPIGGPYVGQLAPDAWTWLNMRPF
jgi:hypothetical protein